MSSVGGLEVLVIGLGPMGRGIARVFSRAGAYVTVADAAPDIATRMLEKLLEEEEAESDGHVPQIAVTDDLATAVPRSQLVVEAIVEDLRAKQRLFGELGKHATQKLMLASNTSSLSISELSEAYPYPHRVLGMHFFNPPTRMKLVEVIRGPKTDDETVNAAVSLCEGLGKTPVICRDYPHFIVNRVCRPLYAEAQLLVTEGVEAPVVDAVARHAFGHRMGPLELLDFTGLHTHLASSETALREFGDPRYRPIPIVRQMVRANQTGRDVGHGFYDYGHGSPREHQARVLREPQSGERGPLVVAGPSAHFLRHWPGEAARLDDDERGEGIVLYSCVPRATLRDFDKVLALVENGRRVVVDSSDARWITSLPPGAGWLRLHSHHDRVFAEVVRDSVAKIEPPSHVDAVLNLLGAPYVEVPALPGLVGDRLRSCLINESALLVQEGIAEPDAIDGALKLGMNHPEGPFEQLETFGATFVLESLRNILEGTGDPRYRPTQLLVRKAAGENRESRLRFRSTEADTDRALRIESGAPEATGDP